MNGLTSDELRSLADMLDTCTSLRGSGIHLGVHTSPDVSISDKFTMRLVWDGEIKQYTLEESFR